MGTIVVFTGAYVRACIHTYINAYMYICIYTNMCVCVPCIAGHLRGLHRSVHTWMHTCIYTYINVYMYICIYTCVCVCVCHALLGTFVGFKGPYIHACMHTHYTHI